MLANYPEMSSNTELKRSINVHLHEIREMNQEFLRLLLHREAPEHDDVLGLHAGILAALRRLTADQQVAIASVPMLLAEFSPLPGKTDSACVADAETSLLAVSEGWQRELQGYSDRLLSCLWQAARRETGMAAHCLGLDDRKRFRLKQMNFSSLSHCAQHAAASLQARLAQHRDFWPDLIASACSGDTVRQTISQLSVIPLSFVGPNPQPVDRTPLKLQTAYRQLR